MLRVPFHLALLRRVSPRLFKAIMVPRILAEEARKADRVVAHMQGPRIAVPDPAQTVARLRQLDMPNIASMADALLRASGKSAEQVFEAARRPNGHPDPDAFLGFHPDISIGKALFQILGAAYPEDSFMELRTYILETSPQGVTPGVYDEDRVRYLFGLMTFIAGDNGAAATLSRHLDITPDLAAIRARIKRARAAYNPEMAFEINLAAQGLKPFNPLDDLFEQSFDTPAQKRLN